MLPIDFVIPWVDGGDPAWIERFNRYAPVKKEIAIDIRAERYRDNGLLRYWFRGVEHCTPWVRKIFFVTDNQKPDWLNLDNKKLVWVKHEDYIPREYLPVFSANPIEIHLHRINDLSETFVYFNDDMYLVNPVKPSFFFKRHLPCDTGILSHPFLGHIDINNIAEINKHFDKNEVFKKYWPQWFTVRYGANLGRTLYCNLSREFLGIFVAHMAQPYLKQTFLEVWEHCGEILRATSSARFRSIADVNQYLFKYWQLVSGRFTPVHPTRHKKYFQVTENNVGDIEKTINRKGVYEVCLNDSDCPPECYDRLIEAFDRKFPDKSGFEI